MAENEKTEKKCGMLKNIIIVVLAPLAVAGVIHLAPAAKAVKAEYDSGTSFKDIQAKYENGGFDAVQHMFDKAPELGASILLQKAVAADSDLRNDVRMAMPRLKKSGVLTQLEQRFLLKKWDAEKAAKAKSKK